MKKILALLLLIGSCGLIMGLSKPIFQPENIIKYDLKNLRADLFKNYAYEKDCWGVDGPIRDCNVYQMKNSNDISVVLFLIHLKLGNLDIASDMWNNFSCPDKYDNNNCQLFPNTLGNYKNIDYYSIPYHEGIITINQIGQDTTLKLAYITIKNNTLYKFKMDGSRSVATPESIEKYKNNQKVNLVLFNSNTKNGYTTIDQVYNDTENNIVIPGGCTVINKVNDKSLLCDNYSAIQGLLSSKVKSKVFDERIIAFKNKIQKLFK